MADNSKDPFQNGKDNQEDIQNLDNQKSKTLNVDQEEFQEKNIDEEQVDKDHTKEKEGGEESITPSRNKRKESMEKQVKMKNKEDKMVRKIVTIVVSVLVLCIVVAGISFYFYFKAGLEPLNKENKSLIQVEIPSGTTSKGIGSILEEKKVIKSGFVFSYYIKKNNLSDFKAGYYQFSPSMTLSEISALLQEGGTADPEALADAKIQIPEGYSLEQIATLIGKKTKFSKDDVLALLKDETFFNKMLKKYPQLLTSTSEVNNTRYKLEGYLFPATYNYYKKNSLESLIEQMIKASNNVMEKYYDKITQSKKSVQQTLTLASLVEKEGVTTADRQKIAQVFYNRMDKEMPLQSDISVLYALGTHKEFLSNKDTQVDSPYNLYLNKGYGPGPFNNPSEDAIMAVLNPDINVSDLYFLADTSTGKVYFAKTYEEHLKLKKQYIDDKTK